MPTGYTAAVQDGTITELGPFALQLARGMGALVTMRDEPWDAPIPERFEPSQYNAGKLVEAQAELARLKAMNLPEAQAAADAEHAEWVRSKAKAETNHYLQRGRYEAMIAKVEAWQNAPDGIKEFALQQLNESLSFDCQLPFEFYSAEPEQDGAEWLIAKLAEVEKMIEHHRRYQAEEDARTDARNRWLSQLRESLAEAK